MKINSTFRVFAFLMAVLIFGAPITIFAQQNPTETKAQIEAEARAQAIADAKNDANKTGWFMAGCFLNILGVAMARTTKAPVPAERLVGKSLTYIVAYTSAYQAKRTEIQTAAAWGGVAACAVGCLVWVYLLVDGIGDGCTFSSSSGGSGGGSGWCNPLSF